MQIYNTIHNKKEAFIPSSPHTISLYVCGITSYDYAHIGHARSAVAFDVWIRLFLFKGFQVNFIRNFTDIDDKIIARAKKEGKQWHEISQEYIQAYHEDMDTLGVMRPTHEPKASEHIDDMIECIAVLIEKDFAYITPDGDVYYRVRKHDTYGSLSGHSIDSLYNNVRIASSVEKEDALDFALWKSAKEGEPYWESPWGKGRPGWHIECTAMSKKYASLPLDIHGGGRDLIFPHHENEKAQTESICECSFVRYWVHNGFVQINAEKMSKSLNNFVTVRDIYSQYMPEVLRYFLLTKHYRSPLTFSLEYMREAEKNLFTIYSALELATSSLLHPPSYSRHNTAFIEEYQQYRERIFEAFDDDCNTAAVLGALFSLVHCLQRAFHEKVKEAVQLATYFVEDIQILSTILGIFQQPAHEVLLELRKSIAKRYGIVVEDIEHAIKEREEARKAKNFTKADEIRTQLEQQGILLQDKPEGTQWSFV